MVIKMVKIVLKSGWVYRGPILIETEGTITLNDYKEGKTEISKDSIAVITRGECQ